MAGLLFFAAAVLGAAVQAAFLPHLPFPLDRLFLPLIVPAFCVFTGRSLHAVLWAAASGLALDLHGFFLFGTETIVLLAAVGAMEASFRRILTNATLKAAFLLAAIGMAGYLAGLAAADGIGLLFGEPPQLLPFEKGFLAGLLLSLAVNGGAVVALLWTASKVRKGFERSFIVSV